MAEIENFGKNVGPINLPQEFLPKVKILKDAKAAKLSDSKGAKTNRVSFVEGDVHGRYSVAYKAITDGHSHDDRYVVTDFFDKRYWVPLKVNAENEGSTWILVNRESLKKRFGITDKEINEHVDKYDLSSLVLEKSKKIQTNLDETKETRGRFVKAAAEKIRKDIEVASKGKIKKRYDFISPILDKDHRYSIAYKSIKDGHEKDKNYNINNPFTKKYWIPWKTIDKNGEMTWILLNKNSLKERFEIDDLTFESISESPGALNDFLIAKSEETSNKLRARGIVQSNRDIYNATVKLGKRIQNFLKNRASSTSRIFTSIETIKNLSNNADFKTLCLELEEKLRKATKGEDSGDVVKAYMDLVKYVSPSKKFKEG